MAQLNEWLTIDKTSGTGNAEITLTASSYEEFVERAATIRVQGKSTVSLLTVKQEAIDPIINVEGDLFFSSAGGPRLLYITCNFDWYIEDGEWYSFDINHGYKNKRGNTTITVLTNGYDKREAQIPIYSESNDSIIGYLTLIQNSFSPNVEEPDDIVNCFYIEPNVADGSIINISFDYVNNTDTSYWEEGEISYYEDGKWKQTKCSTGRNGGITIKTQNRLYFKNFKRGTKRRKNGDYFYLGSLLHFSIQGACNVGGDITTLLGTFKNVYGSDTNIYYARELFGWCDVVDATNLILPNETSYGCYEYMFAGCSSLTGAPSLPAISLSEYCYSHMFDSCSSLVTAPSLPAIGLGAYCYLNMFEACTSLENTPKLSARFLKKGCYESMFWNCINVKRVEMLGNYFSKDSTANMLEGVNKEGTFVIYRGTSPSNTWMPSGWEIVESDEILRPSTQQLKQSNIWVEFEERNGLIQGGFTDNAQGQYFVHSFDGVNWERGGYVEMGDNKIVFINSTDRGVSGQNIRFNSNGKVGGNMKNLGLSSKLTFISNTYLTDASELILHPYTEKELYMNMFNGCTSLVSPPTIYAPALTESCCDYMFYGCSSLQYIRLIVRDTSAYGALDSWVDGVPSTGTFVKHPDATLPIGTDGIPNGWTVETATS